MMGEVRLTNLNMTITECAKVLSGNFQNSYGICLDLLREGSKVDPDDIFQGFSNLLQLDTMGIWDEQIYTLYKDVCKSNVSKVIALLRAYQLGQLAGATEEAIKYAIAHRGEGIDIDAVVKAVKNRLPAFNPY